MAKFLIVEARFYAHLNDMLIAGARGARQQGRGDRREAGEAQGLGDIAP